MQTWLRWPLTFKLFSKRSSVKPSIGVIFDPAIFLPFSYKIPRLYRPFDLWNCHWFECFVTKNSILNRRTGIICLQSHFERRLLVFVILQNTDMFAAQIFVEGSLRKRDEFHDSGPPETNVGSDGKGSGQLKFPCSFITANEGKYHYYQQQKVSKSLCLWSGYQCWLCFVWLWI